MKKESTVTKTKRPKRVSNSPKRKQGISVASNGAAQAIKNNGAKAIPVVIANKESVPKTNLWITDKMHSSLEFSARHMKLADIGGRFNNFDVKFFSNEEDFSDAIVEVSARVDSLDTGNELRDKALKGEAWLNSARFPVISFNSTSLKKVKGNQYELMGNLTIGNISHSVHFDATLNGKFTNPYPKRTKCGFTITGYISRGKFDLGADSTATGVSNEIIIGANIELMKEV